MKKFYTLALLLLTASLLHAQNFNMTFRSNKTYTGDLANIGHYVDALGNEYALVGYEYGLSIVDVTDPANPIEKFVVTGPTSIWREVKTWSTYAYVTTEGGNTGLQIVDLSDLPNSVNSKYWNGTGAINGQLQTIHALHIDAGYVYLFGSNLFAGAAVIADLADPWNPVYVGHTTGTYIHDGYVRNDTLWAGHIYQGYFGVWDVTNKANPVLLAQQSTPNTFTHNTWLNDAGTVLMTTDETTGSFLTSYDITDLANIRELDRFQTTPGSGSIVHNTHVLNDYAITSWYKDGVSIVDISHPDNLIEVAHYDTYPQGSGDGFYGCWGVDPFLPSGNIIASDINNGLYVLTPVYQRACYLEGIVTDSVSAFPLNNATVVVTGPSLTEVTNLLGVYKTGTVNAGTYSVTVSRPGYQTKTINNVVLVNGQLTQLDVQLVSLTAFTATGQVIDGITGFGVPLAQVRIYNGVSDNVIVCDANGNFAIPAFTPDVYNVDAGQWGYYTYCSNNNPVNLSTVPMVVSLLPGIADDFTFDLGWTVSGVSGNAWERGVPIGTVTTGPGGGQQANPGSDAPGDCRDKAYVTDNGGGGAWDHDVDAGNTILTSPSFDATGFLNPQIHYTRWFYNGGNNGGGPADDTMSVRLSNGITTVTLEMIFPSSPNPSSWVDRTWSIGQYITPTANMHFSVETADWGPVFNIVEGGLDKFEITEGPASVHENSSYNLTAYPNPFTSSIRMTFDAAAMQSGGTLRITDITGKLVSEIPVQPSLGYVDAGNGLDAGIYFARIITPAGSSAPVKINKLR
ncbi:MAG TPA: choice-of-anchor B family protein [Bacteroidia bacterium]|nr:choice-of-anchor B family protein [Bacteroidia bacterium]